MGSVPSAMILWHDVHIGMATVTLVFSAISTPSKQFRYGYSGLYILCSMVILVCIGITEKMLIEQTEFKKLGKRNLIVELASS